jgi:4-hydroxybenzoate polyprenyltransferase
VPLLLSLVVLLWTAGFDVLYSCQDYDFDVKAGLHSIPRRFGIARSLLLARLFHVGAFIALLVLYWITHLGVFALIGVVASAVLLFDQHRLLRADDLSKLNAAFFTTNAFVSVILFITFGGAALLRTLP